MSLLWHHVYIEHSQSVHYFAHSFPICQLPRQVTSTREINTFSNKTCLNVKHQPFIFQHIVQIYFNTYWDKPVRPYERLDCSDLCIGHRNNTSARSFFIKNTFLSMSKQLTPNMYCWSCKTLVTIYRTHLRVNGIWAKWFCPQKTNNKMLFLTGWLSTVMSPYLSFTNKATLTSLY